jgi:two-component SAPR family response regulator
VAKIDSVLRHAITAPTFDQTKLHRDRLVDELHADIPRKLIAIAAPPGYGKTTLLADFTAHTELPVCWVRITEADRDVLRFASILNNSLQKRFRRIKNAIDLDKLFSTPPEALAHIFAEVIDANISDTFVIVLDDIHLINSSKSTLAFIDTLLDVLPEQVTLVAAGREVIEVSLARLMAAGDLGGMGPQDLALTRDEIIDIAGIQSGLSLTEDHADRLLNETKGWITGLILSGEISGKDIPSLVFEARPMVYEYLASIVLNRQPDDLRRFMLDSSVFPVMTADACDEVLKREDSQRYLTRLLREGLFVSATNESPRIYEYHPQFREFLLDSSRGANPKKLQTLQIRAAKHLAEGGSIEQAVELYFNAGDHKKAARLAEKYAEDLYGRGRWRTLESWAEMMRDVDVTVPRVHLHLARQYLDQGNIDQMDEAIRSADEMIDSGASKADQALVELNRANLSTRREQYLEAEEAANMAKSLLGNRGSKILRVSYLRVRARVAAQRDGKYKEALKDIQRAANLLAGTDSLYTLASTLQDEALYKSALGLTREALATSLRVHEILLKLGNPLPLAGSFNNLAYLAHLQGRYQEALELYVEGLKYARQGASLRHETAILFGQADLFSDLSLALQAAELYGQALTVAIQIDDPEWIRYGCIQTSALHRRRGGNSLANEWLSRAVSLDEKGSLSPIVQLQMSALEVDLRPEHVSESMKHIFSVGGKLNASQKTIAHFINAKAELTLGHLEAASEAITEALDWAGANGTEQFLAGELAFDEDLRSFARSHAGRHPVLALILRRIEAMRVVSQQYQETIEDVAPPDILTMLGLGQTRALGGGQDASELKPLAREVLFFLVDCGQVERDVLLEKFWPHHPPGRQVANLHTAIYSLRRMYGKDVILHEGTAYSVNLEIPLEYDVERFERAAAVVAGLPPGDPRRMFALTEAINSYGGPLLPEFSSDWVLERRRALEMRYLDLLAQHAQEAMMRDQPARALQTLRQALEIDPYRDDTNMHFLEALGRLGRRSEVVEHYQRYVQLLSNELGLDPPDAVRELYTRLIG